MTYKERGKRTGRGGGTANQLCWGWGSQQAVGLGGWTVKQSQAIRGRRPDAQCSAKSRFALKGVTSELVFFPQLGGAGCGHAL
ncbi:hypothetical protein MHYP_G00184790 [Metynnis hypsauchen]